MIVKARRGVVVREHADGRLTYSIRRRSEHRHELLVLGGPEDGWTEATATIAAGLFAPPPNLPTREMCEALRRMEARALRGRDRRRRHA